MVPVCICGGSGYTGVELIRLLSGHPDVKIVAITSERQKGQVVTSIYPHLKGVFEEEFRSIEDPALLKEAEVFFLALPHGEALKWTEHFYDKGKFVIDLSADCRLRDPEDYEQWYGLTHKRPDLLKVAAYGIPEIYRERIQASRLVANPGCYPTGALLGLYPLVREDLIETDRIIIDSKSGVSGAGRKADLSLIFTEVNESFKAYGVTTHRHTPEIEMVLTELTGQKTTVEFTPHLLPVTRGILTTIYAKLKTPKEEKALV
ncbi:MAG: N-acetyl-gamma-glutamyl-phosphate reductase, partial [Nitrospirae bacterium]